MYPAKKPTPAANTPHAPARERSVPVLTPEELLTRREFHGTQEGEARTATTITGAATETFFVKTRKKKKTQEVCCAVRCKKYHL